MKNKRTTVLANALIWCGAAISIAEIITGTYFAPLGIKKGLTAIILGHVIGGFLLFFTGLIGAKTRKTSMETTKLSFGFFGSIFFAVLNVVQLLGWTGIMIYDGACAANEALNLNTKIWSVVICAFILIWILIGIKNLGKINLFAVSGLFILTIILGKIIFLSNNPQVISEYMKDTITFGNAVELSAAMPISWLPLISDYTKEAEKPIKATLASTISYCIISCYMYTIGMGAAIFTGETDISKIMVKAGLGFIALLIVIISTVTTTFMDAFSAGISMQTISSKINGKIAAAITAVTGALLAIFLPLYDISNFLYFIGSVFAPMTAIMLADYFVSKSDNADKKIDLPNIFIWLIGFILYRILLKINLSAGCTLPDMAVTFILAVLYRKIIKKRK